MAKTKSDREADWATKTRARQQAMANAMEALSPGQRRELQPSADLLEGMAAELVPEICGAASQRVAWHKAGRFGAAASSAAAAGSGGALTAGLEGTGGVALGVVALILGLVGAVATSVGADSEYARQLHKYRGYEQLWWDIWIYATIQLPTARPAECAEVLSGFASRKASIADPGPVSR